MEDMRKVIINLPTEGAVLHEVDNEIMVSVGDYCVVAKKVILNEKTYYVNPRIFECVERAFSYLENQKHQSETKQEIREAKAQELAQGGTTT